MEAGGRRHYDSEWTESFVISNPLSEIANSSHDRLPMLDQEGQRIPLPRGLSEAQFLRYLNSHSKLPAAKRPLIGG